MVAPGGEGWVARFQRCLDAAIEVTYATDGAFLGDDVLYRYGSELAMGMTMLRARSSTPTPTILRSGMGYPPSVTLEQPSTSRRGGPPGGRS